MLDKNPAASTLKAPLVKRLDSPPISYTPPFETRDYENALDLGVFDNYKESYPYGISALSLSQRLASRDPSVSLGEEVDDPYGFDESNSDSDAPRRVGPNPYLRMDVDDDIADAAGLPANGKREERERQVPLISCNKLLL